MKLIVALVILALAGIVLCAPEKNTARKHKVDKKWLAFKAKHMSRLRMFKTDDDEANHYENFVKIDAIIEANNAKFEKGESSYQLAHNPQSAESEEERRVYNGFIAPEEPRLQKRLAVDYDITSCNAPAAYDWVDNFGWKTAVRDQQECGSCWAFTACGALEAAYYIQNKKAGLTTPSDFVCSPQHMVSCSKSPTYQTYACNGAYYGAALDFINANGGVVKESKWKYKNTNGTCSDVAVSESDKVFKTGILYQRIIPNNYNAFKCALATRGPVMISLNGQVPEFQSYKTGVIRFAENWQTNHAVLAVGYGKDAGGDFIRVKNSWGTTNWGENGYGRIYINTARNALYSGMFSQNVSPVLPSEKIGYAPKPYNGLCSDNQIPASGVSGTFCTKNKVVCNTGARYGGYLIEDLCPITCDRCPKACSVDSAIAASWGGCAQYAKYCGTGTTINGFFITNECSKTCCSAAKATPL